MRCGQNSMVTAGKVPEREPVARLTDKLKRGRWQNRHRRVASFQQFLDTTWLEKEA
jgi:hypothetical protein